MRRVGFYFSPTDVILMSIRMTSGFVTLAVLDDLGAVGGFPDQSDAAVAREKCAQRVPNQGFVVATTRTRTTSTHVFTVSRVSALIPSPGVTISRPGRHRS